MHVQAAEVYQSYSWAGFTTGNRDLLGQLPAYGKTDLAVGASEGAFAYEAFVNNAFDRRANTYSSPICYTTTAACGVYNYPINPRKFGLRVGMKF